MYISLFTNFTEATKRWIKLDFYSGGKEFSILRISSRNTFYCINRGLTDVSTWPHLVLKHNIFAHYRPTVDLGVESF